MSYPPPPGTGAASSLPPRPPPSTVASSFARFAPRQVAQHHSVVSAAPQTYSAAPTTQYSSTAYSSAPTTYQSYQVASYTPPTAYPVANTAPHAAPHIVNPFPLPGARKDPRFPDLDPELQAQIAQQQSIYDPANAENLKARQQQATKPAVAAVVEAGGAASGVSGKGGKAGVHKEPTVMRHGGGQTWTDSSLLEWDPSHFRLFVGNLAGEVTDDSLLKAFSKYPSVKKARVIRDKRTTKSKGYGFVAFADGDEYFKAAREMQGKYIGSHPVLLKRSNTEIKPVVVGGNKTKGGRVDKKKGKKGRNERKVLG